MVLVLTLVAVIMGGILALVNHLTEGPISEVNKKKTDDGIKAVMSCDNLTLAKTDTVRQDISGKEYTYIIIIYVHIKLNHFAAYLKLTQHCKSTLLQSK